MRTSRTPRRKKDIALSPSALNLFRDCQRCFWLDKVHGIRRPRGIFPSLPSGMDRVIKEYFDRYRAEGTLPPEFPEETFKNTCLYQDQDKLNLWREWRTGMRFKDEDGSALFGAIDDLLVCDGQHIPFDYKTKGSPTTVTDAKRYYQNQMDCYAFLLEKNGMPLCGWAYLLYFSPKAVNEKGWVNFHMQAIKMEINTDRALKTFREATQLIKSDVPPTVGACEYCAWIQKMDDARQTLELS